MRSIGVELFACEACGSLQQCVNAMGVWVFEVINVQGNCRAVTDVFSPL